MKRTTNFGHEIPAGEQAPLARRIQTGEAGNTPGSLASQPQVHAVAAVPLSDLGAPVNPDDNGQRAQPAATAPSWRSPESAGPDHHAITLQQLAAQGDPDAQLKLGQMYYDGTDAPQDLAKAFEWFEKSAEHGLAQGQAALGRMFFLGEVKAQNYGQAFHWFGKAAAQGDDNAMYHLGIMYRDGKGIGKDLHQAFDWFKKSAEQGTARAQAALGRMLYLGIGVKTDYELAFAWSSKAAAQGNAAGELYLAEMYRNGEGVREDVAKALALYEQSANRGFDQAQVALGRMYFFGIGVRQDYRSAFKWYSAAAAQGRGVPARLVGGMYRTGQGVDQDLTKAFEWIMKSAEQGDVEGQTALGEMYASGEGVEQNHTEAMHWFCQSGTQGNVLVFPFTPHCNALLPHLEMELNKRPNVTELVISKQQLDGYGAQSIAGLIENNRTLERLLIQDNRINPVGAQAIMAAVRRNTALKAVNATGNPGFSNEMHVEIAQCGERNTRSALLIATYVDKHPIRISEPLPPEVSSLVQHALIMADQGRADPLTGALLYPTMQATEQRILEFSYAIAYDAITRTRQQTALRADPAHHMH